LKNNITSINNTTNSINNKYNTTVNNQKNTKGEFYSYSKFNNNINIFNLEHIIKNGMKSIIGKGASSIVYLVKQKNSSNTYALKEINKKMLTKIKNNLNIVYKEINIQSRLKHPNIVELYNIYENKDKIYLILENCKNGSLFNYIKMKKGLNEEESFYFFKQVLDAVYFLHKNNIIHRDIKPENLLLTKINNNSNKLILKLCDFGWATLLDENKNTRNTFCGTYEYMAPEIINKKEYSKGIDIWSLGILLYEMIHNFSPFRDKYGNNILNILENIKRDKIIYYKDISNECKDLIEKMLEKNENKRITIKEIYEHSFFVKYHNSYKNNKKVIRNIIIDNGEIEKKSNKELLNCLNSCDFNTNFNNNNNNNNNNNININNINNNNNNNQNSNINSIVFDEDKTIEENFEKNNNIINLIEKNKTYSLIIKDFKKDNIKYKKNNEFNKYINNININNKNNNNNSINKSNVNLKNYKSISLNKFKKNRKNLINNNSLIDENISEEKITHNDLIKYKSPEPKLFNFNNNNNIQIIDKEKNNNEIIKNEENKDNNIENTNLNLINKKLKNLSSEKKFNLIPIPNY